MKRGGFLCGVQVWSLMWTQLLVSESFSGNGEFLPSRRSSRLPPPLLPQHHDEPRPFFFHQRHHHHHQHPGALTRLMSAALLERGSHQTPNLPEHPGHDVQLEQAVVSAQHLVTVYLAVDVRRLNVSLLRWFRDGLAAALGVPPGRVHINRLNEKKNGIELFVSSDRPGIPEPRPADDVIQSLNVRVLHRHLGLFGITEVSSQKKVLPGQNWRHGWNREGYYTIVLFFTVFIIIIACLMVLYRLKEKVWISDRQLKAPPLDLHLTASGPPDSEGQLKGTKVVTPGSMVQVVATPTPQQQPIRTCQRLIPPIIPVPSPAPILVDSSIGHALFASSDHTPFASNTPVTAYNELKPCPSPFRMKPAAGLQERRGSNVSLVLDMSALGAVEPLSAAVVTPREAAAREYLLSAGRPMTRQQLREAVSDTQKLHAQFTEIPMNFIDPKELDVPNHGSKNRYKTILPNPHSRVILKSKSYNDPLSSYINANYIRGYLGDDKTFIATQGPMVNTVNDFWWMAWQEEAPVIVMITKLKEKNEKCVLYWPEKRGIYGRVEVLVNDVRESEHYTTRSLTLKCGNQTRDLQHYWFTSWPDHKTPDSTLPLLQLMTEVETDRRAATAGGPVIVHCSAGIGRTGCFIATTIGCRQLQLEGVVDVLSITCQLRADRGGMIQTCEQYEFVHHALSLFEARLSAETGQ